MKRIVVLATLLVISVPLYTQDLALPYEITRQEWLEYEVFRNVKIETDAWLTRIAFRTSVTYEDGEYTLGVVLTTANGEASLDDTQRNYYVTHVTSVVQRILDQYEWAAEIGIVVLFV